MQRHLNEVLQSMEGLLWFYKHTRGKQNWASARSCKIALLQLFVGTGTPELNKHIE